MATLGVKGLIAFSVHDSLSNGVSATHSVQVVGSAVCDCCELFR